VILFVTGIDTGIGKTIATGLLAAWFRRQGRHAITQKLVQTGVEGASEDVRVHRHLMGTGLLPEDREGLTCPAIYPFPASPHLAARLAGDSVNIERIVDCTNRLASCHDIVLAEGAGGLMVPLTRQTTTIDVIARQAWPVVLVTSSRLGSINHTLLSLIALQSRAIELAAVLYNLHHPAPREIMDDTRQLIREVVANMGMDAPVIDVPEDADANLAPSWDPPALRQLLRYASRGMPRA